MSNSNDEQDRIAGEKLRILANQVDELGLLGVIARFDATLAERDLARRQLSDSEAARRRAVKEREELRAVVASLKAERDQLKAGLEGSQSRLCAAEHIATCAIDNGDGTVTAMLPVTHPKGLGVSEVRSRKIGDVFAYWKGESTADADDDDHANVWLILRPAPKPPEPVTWEAPLVDGEWLADEEFVTRVGGGGYGLKWGHVRGLSKPAKLGTYQFKDGVGTLVVE